MGRTRVADPAGRDWLLYRFWDADGQLLYIGITSRAALARWMEHIDEQWWADQIVTMQVAPVRYASKADAEAAEKLAIETEWPLHNDKHNHGNPYRVLPPVGWTRPRRSRPAASPGQGRRPPARRRVRWTRRRIRAATLTAVWLVLAIALWWTVGDRVPASNGAELGAIGATVVVAGAWRRPRRRRR